MLHHVFGKKSKEKKTTVTFKHIYQNKEIQTNITKAEIREIILLCTKGVHFTFCGETFTQTDPVAMGSPLRPVLVGMYMVELFVSCISNLGECSPLLSQLKSVFSMFIGSEHKRLC